jgi:hypothetical protein
MGVADGTGVLTYGVRKGDAMLKMRLAAVVAK